MRLTISSGATLIVLAVFVGAVRGDSLATIIDESLVRPTAGISLDYPADYQLVESEGIGAYHAVLLDPAAQAGPQTRGEMTRGGMVQLSVLDFVPKEGVREHLLKGASLSGAVTDSGSVEISGVPGELVGTISSGESDAATKTVSFVYERRWFLLVFAVRPAADFDLYQDVFGRILASVSLFEPSPMKAGLQASKFLVLPATQPLNVQQGWYYHPDVGGGLHQAIDYIDTPINTPATAFPVTASDAGTALYTAGDGWNGGLGLFVRITHSVQGAAYYTTYAHLASSPLTPGVANNVTLGQVIGIAGTTGLTGGYRHLHFVLENSNGARIDPYDIYQNRDYYPSPCGPNYNWKTCPPSHFYQPAGALAAGDFNGDGKADLAVGVPGEDIGSVKNAGAVQVLYGTSNGLTATSPDDQLWYQGINGLDLSAEEGDMFGAALASADFNSDGYADLAIGAPGEGVPVVDGGSVRLTRTYPGLKSRFMSERS